MSSNYVVSALKYRPQLFNTVIGQSHITTTLKNAIKSEQLAHSFLFCGPRGVGKTTCARILAKTINCINITSDGEACDKCTSCVSNNEHTSFNVYEMDAASNNSVDDIRELIEQVRFAPQGGNKYKVYIIDEVHMLSASAFNAFLKTLEEPPHYAIFILATTEKHKILPTILSRCQIFDFNRINTDDIVNHLSEICEKENVSAEKEALHLIAQKSEGCMRDALSIMDKIASFSQQKITYLSTVEHLNILDYDYYFKITEAMMMQDISNSLLLYNEIFNKGFEGDMFLNGFTEHFRNLLICKDQKVAILLDLPENIKKKYYQQSNQLNQAYILNALSILNETEINYRLSRNKRMHVELALIKINYLNEMIEIISDENDAVVKKKLLSNNLTVLKEKKTSSTPKISISNTITHTIIEPIIKKEPVISANAVSEKINSYGLQLDNIKKLKSNTSEKLNSSNKNNLIEINDEQLTTAWYEIFEKITEGKIIYKNNIKESSISHVGNDIIFNVSPIAFEFMTKKRLQMLESFIAYFHNEAINVIIKEKNPEPNNQKKVLTSKEIFEKMAVKNPSLKILKDNLSLTIDY